MAGCLPQSLRRNWPGLSLEFHVADYSPIQIRVMPTKTRHSWWKSKWALPKYQADIYGYLEVFERSVVVWISPIFVLLDKTSSDGLIHDLNFWRLGTPWYPFGVEGSCILRCTEKNHSSEQVRTGSISSRSWNWQTCRAVGTVGTVRHHVREDLRKNVHETSMFWDTKFNFRVFST